MAEGTTFDSPLIGVSCECLEPSHYTEEGNLQPEAICAALPNPDASDQDMNDFLLVVIPMEDFIAFKKKLYGEFHVTINGPIDLGTMRVSNVGCGSLEYVQLASNAAGPGSVKVETTNNNK